MLIPMGKRLRPRWLVVSSFCLSIPANNPDDGDDYDYYDDDDDVPSKGSINHSKRYSTFALSSTLLLIWN